MKARFRKKSSTKKEPPQLDADPFRSPPVVPSLELKLPASDFRSSRILPDLGKRFSLLARTEDPAVIKHKLERLRQATGGSAGLTREEEDLVFRELQQLREDQASGFDSTSLGGPSSSSSSSQRPYDLPARSRTLEADTVASSPSSSNFFGGLSNEAEYMRKAKRTASNKNLAGAAAGAGSFRMAGRRRGASNPPSSPLGGDSAQEPPLSAPLALPTSTSFNSFLSEPDSTVELASLQDLPSPDALPVVSNGLAPPEPDRSRRRSLLDSLSPAQVKRISTTLALLEDSLFEPTEPLPSEGDVPDTPSAMSRSPSPHPPSGTHSPYLDRALETVVEPPAEADGGQFDVEALESFSPEPSPLPRKGGPAKRVPSSSGYVPGPRPIRNRSLSASSSPAQAALPSLASPPPSIAHLSPNISSDRTSTPSIGESLASSKALPVPSLLSPSERDWASRSPAQSDSSHAGPGESQLFVADQQAAYIASPLESSWASHSSSGGERQSPSSSRRELRGTRDLGRDTFHFGADGEGSQPARDDAQGDLTGRASAFSDDSRSQQAHDTSADRTASPRAPGDTSQLEEEELLDSHSAQFADRLPSSFDYNHGTGPAPSASSMALHGHQLSMSSTSSFAHSRQHAQEPTHSWHSRPESADSDALLPTPIEARAGPSLRSQRSDASLASTSGGSSFRSGSGWKTLSMADLDGADARTDDAQSLFGASVDAPPSDAAAMEELLLSSSGLGRQDIALVHQRLVESHGSSPQAESETATPRAFASELFAGPTGAAEKPAGEARVASPTSSAERAAPGSPPRQLVLIPSPLSSTSNVSSQPTGPYHRNQRSRASSILDPELNGSTDVLNQYFASTPADSRSATSQTSVSQAGEPAAWAPTSSTSTTNPSQTDFTSSPYAAADVFASPSADDTSAPRPPPSFSPTSPGAVHDRDFVDDFRAKIDAADSALKKSPSMPRVGASKLIRGKSLKRTMPTISQPQLISSTSKAGATAITITPPPPLPLPERAQTVGHSASKSMSERFKRLTGRRKSKDNLKDPSWMQDLPPSPTVGTSPRIPPSWPTSPQQQDAAAGGDAFRFPSRAATASPPASPVDPSGKKTFMGRLRPRKTLDNISTSPEPALDGRVHPHTAPLLAARQFSGPPMEGSAHSPAPASDGDGSSPAPVQRSASFKSGHSHASSVHALFDAASKLGIDAQDVDALLRRSNSASQRSNPTYDSAYLQQQQGVATPPMTRATSTRSQLAVDSIIEDPCEEQQAVDGPERRVPVSVSAQSGLSQSSAISSLSKSGSIMRRTVILPQENGRLSFQAPSPAAREAPPPPPAKAGLPRSPAKARLSAIAATLPTPDVPLPSPPHDRRPPFMTKSSLSPSERSFSRAGHSSANASLFDLYHGHDDDDEYLADGELDDARRSRALSSTSVVQPGQAIEILEMSNGDVLYSVLQGLRDIEDVEDAWDTRSDAASTMDRPPSSVMDEPVQLTFRGQRYDGPDLSRRSLFKPSKAPRPETKIFYSSSKAVADLIHEISAGHDQGQLQFTTSSASPTSPNFHRSLSFNSSHHLPLNVPKRSVSIKRPNPPPPPLPLPANDSDSRFSDAPSIRGSDYSVSTKLDRMMSSVLDQAVAAEQPSAGGSTSLDVPQRMASRHTATRF